MTFKVSPPLGVYDADKLVNIGTNRWTFEPGVGISKALGSWIIEGSAAATFYTDNNEFDGDKTRQQAPVYSTQLHITYNSPRQIWLAVSATYYNGGRTTIADKSNADLQQNWRTGLTLALPVNRFNSIKYFPVVASVRAQETTTIPSASPGNTDGVEDFRPKQIFTGKDIRSYINRSQRLFIGDM